MNGDRAAGALLPLLYRTGAESGWSVGMRRVTRALLARMSLPPGPVVDLGCGDAILVTELARAWPNRPVFGLERHPVALGHAPAAVAHRLAQGDVRALPFPDASIGTLLALDTLDQRGVDLPCALVETRRVLMPGGLLLIRVSAHPPLYGPHDVAFNTARRFTRAEIVAAVTAAGLDVAFVTYANALVGAPAAVLRLLQRHEVAEFAPALYAMPVVNWGLRVALTLEAAWLRRRNLPVGLSLYVGAWGK